MKRQIIRRTSFGSVIEAVEGRTIPDCFESSGSQLQICSNRLKLPGHVCCAVANQEKADECLNQNIDRKMSEFLFRQPKIRPVLSG